jgi:hypothetical protein
MSQEINLHGFNLKYDGETAQMGVHYLKDKIDESEAKAFFDEARHSYEAKAHFKDSHGYNFTLVFDGGNNYTVRQRVM